MIHHHAHKPTPDDPTLSRRGLFDLYANARFDRAIAAARIIPTIKPPAAKLFAIRRCIAEIKAAIGGPVRVA